jgi:hypothetical protein
LRAEKNFDCVEMKAEIQAKLLREVADWGDDAARQRRAERLSQDPILGEFLRSKLAESGTDLSTRVTS